MLLAWLMSAAIAGSVHYEPEGAPASSPVFSPDGKWLAFDADVDGRPHLFVSSVSGAIAKNGVEVPLPGARDAAWSLSDPAWHPHGILLASGGPPRTPPRLFMYQPGGGAASELLNEKQAPGSLTTPALSPDGVSVAFVEDGDLAVWERTDNTIRRLTSGASLYAPAWSADSRTIAVTRNRPAGGLDVVLVDATTGAITEVAASPDDDERDAVWAGSSLVWWRRHGDAWTIDAAVAGGGSPQRDAGGHGTAAGQPPVTLATDATAWTGSHLARIAVLPGGPWVAWVPSQPQDVASVVELATVDGRARLALQTDHAGLVELAFTRDAGGGLVMAYTWRDGDRGGLSIAAIEDVTVGTADGSFLPLKDALSSVAAMGTPATSGGTTSSGTTSSETASGMASGTTSSGTTSSGTSAGTSATSLSNSPRTRRGSSSRWFGCLGTSSPSADEASTPGTWRIAAVFLVLLAAVFGWAVARRAADRP